MDRKYGIDIKWLAVTSFEMRFGGRDLDRIDCKTKFEVHGEKIGIIGDKMGLEKSITVNGHVHDGKLNFNMNLCMDKNRKMFRDLPYSISEWEGDVRKTEDYWYEKDLGVYASYSECEEAQKRFLSMNESTLSRCELTNELFIDRLKVDVPSSFWGEGFDTCVGGK